MCDTGEAGGGVYKRQLLWSAVNSGGVRDLNGPVEPMIAADELGSFGGLLAIWR